MVQAHWLDIAGIRAGLEGGTLGAEALAEHQLTRIAARRDNAIVTLTPDLALDAARQVDQGQLTGPLAGVPMVIKDIVDVKGVATTVAMPSRRDHRAGADATVVARLRAAGAVILGKANMTEGAYAEHRPPFGAPVNPWSADHWCGASSSGSGVAVAAGLATAAIGTETGGSIRLPSAMNGTTGLKPTWGRVSRHGVHELAASLDTVGPLARSAEDVARIYQVIAGHDPRDATSTTRGVESDAGDLRGYRIGVDPRFAGADVDAQVSAAQEAAIAVLVAQGARIVPVAMPDTSRLIWDFFDICAVEAAIAHRDHFDAHADSYGPVLADVIRRGRALDAVTYEDLQRRRRAFRGALDAMLDQVDGVLSPVLSFPVPTSRQMAAWSDELIGGLHRFTCPFTISGHPAVCFPAGVCSAGLPINLQLIGRAFGEATLLRGARGFQAVTDYHLRHPEELSR